VFVGHVQAMCECSNIAQRLEICFDLGVDTLYTHVFSLPTVFKAYENPRDLHARVTV
jgi:hypothetical protein